jgi:hypothetical protein
VYRLIGLFLMAGISAQAQAQMASASLSEDSAQVKYGAFVGGQSSGRSEMGAGFLFNEDSDYVAEMGLKVVNSAGTKAPNLTVGVGGKVFAATVSGAGSAQDTDIVALGLGGELDYTMPFNDRLSVGASFYYAPSIVSFLDAERFRDVSARVSFAVLPEATAYVEYQQFHVTLDDDRGSGDIEKGARLGLQINF